MYDCLPFDCYKKIVLEYKRDREDARFIYLSDLGVLENVLHLNVIVTLFTSILQRVEELKEARLLDHISSNPRSAPCSDTALLNTPPIKRRRETPDEEWESLLVLQRAHNRGTN